ncbi:bZIP transcription factor [Clostridium sp. JS66]|uniref:bZIP transcription factor n=1 Tax=Clostridium sp. JS66 TaxID=3064705 RepID=UPI00298EBD15|nr:bZIP transcription factor [Clostridium sp. JS66]WPC40606.1 bZIP transcription factor [Clostridium sp. JS66]
MLNVQEMSILVMLGVVMGVLGIMLIVVPALKKNGINGEANLKKIQEVVGASDAAIKAVDGILPGNKAVGILKVIEKWAIIAVGHAQQLYYTKSIDKDERKKVAQDVIYKMLRELNVELTESRQYLINAAIENAVNDLGHTDSTEAEKQAQKQELQTKVIQLTTENTNLKNTINDITNAVSIVKSAEPITQ